MVYIRNGRRAHLEALRIQQQIAAAELEKLEREVAEIRAAEQELARLQRRKEQAAQELRATINRTQTVRTQIKLGPPIHGGPEGLKAAAREAAEHEYKTGIMARKPRQRRAAA